MLATAFPSEMSRTASLIGSLALLHSVHAQQVGTLISEVHPPLTWQKCTSGAGCTTQAGQITLDENWRFLHAVGSTTACFTENVFSAPECPNPVTCAANCALDGADYAGSGITTSGNAITLKLTTGTGFEAGSRSYLMDSPSTYQIFHPLNQEISFDVDASTLPCGFGGSLYFVEMDADGGKAKYPTNKAGAAYGTGYCDASCPKDLKFINGQVREIGVATFDVTEFWAAGKCARRTGHRAQYV